MNGLLTSTTDANDVDVVEGIPSQGDGKWFAFRQKCWGKHQPGRNTRHRNLLRVNVEQQIQSKSLRTGLALFYQAWKYPKVIIRSPSASIKLQRVWVEGCWVGDRLYSFSFSMLTRLASSNVAPVKTFDVIHKVLSRDVFWSVSVRPFYPLQNQHITNILTSRNHTFLLTVPRQVMFRPWPLWSYVLSQPHPTSDDIVLIYSWYLIDIIFLVVHGDNSSAEYFVSSAFWSDSFPGKRGPTTESMNSVAYSGCLWGIFPGWYLSI